MVDMFSCLFHTTTTGKDPSSFQSMNLKIKAIYLVDYQWKSLKTQVWFQSTFIALFFNIFIHSGYSKCNSSEANYVIESSKILADILEVTTFKIVCI